MDGLQFYRCILCKKVISAWDIKKKGCCPNCGQFRVAATNLTTWEKVKQIVKHPAVWNWKNVEPV